MTVIDRSFEEHLKVLKDNLNSNNTTRFRSEFLSLHSYEKAKLFHQLTKDERNHVYQTLSPSELAKVIDEAEAEDDQVDDYFNEMNDNYAANVLAEMYADNAVDVLNNLKDQTQVSTYLQMMPPQAAREISRLLNYLDNTAGAIMTPEFIAVSQSSTVDEAYQYLKKVGREAETIYYVYVIDAEGRLVGVLSLRDLILSEDTKKIKEIMRTRVIYVNVNDDQEEVSRMVRDYNLLALPVVGFDHELLGIITVDDVLDVIEEEAESDYSKLAAVDVSEVHESPFSAAKSRLPWLITLLFLGMGTATVISQYESLIAEASILSAFVTLITGTAGNAGTQSLAVAVRKLTNKTESDSLSKSVAFELLTGFITGAVVGISVTTIVFVWQRNLLLGLIIGVAMMAAIFVANLAGALIPKMMSKLGFDPAVASGPFISTLSDLTSVFIYFSIASLSLAYLT